MSTCINTKGATQGSRYKLRMREPKYYIHTHKGTVACVIECGIPAFPHIPKIEKKFFNIKEFLSAWDFKVTGVAKCGFSDTFDEAKGMKLAESRAKAKALAKAMKIIEAYNKMANSEMERIQNSLDFFESELIKEENHLSKLLK